MKIDRVRAKLETKKKRLAEYMAAEEAILGGAQAYTIGNRNLTRATLSTIQEEIDKLEDEIDELEGLLEGQRPRRAVAVVPRDF